MKFHQIKMIDSLKGLKRNSEDLQFYLITKDVYMRMKTHKSKTNHSTNNG
jgi:hypothetical protein